MVTFKSISNFIKEDVLDNPEVLSKALESIEKDLKEKKLPEDEVKKCLFFLMNISEVCWIVENNWTTFRIYWNQVFLFANDFHNVLLFDLDYNQKMESFNLDKIRSFIVKIDDKEMDLKNFLI